MTKRDYQDWRDEDAGIGVYGYKRYDGTRRGRRAAIRETKAEERRDRQELRRVRRELGELAYQRALGVPGHIARALGGVAASSIAKLRPELVVRPERLSIPDNRITGGPELREATNRQRELATMLSAKSVDPRSGAIKVPFWRPEEVGLDSARYPIQTRVAWTDEDEGDYLTIRAQGTSTIERDSSIGVEVEVDGPRRSKITTFYVPTGYNQTTKASVCGDKIVDFDIVYLDKNDRERSLLSSADRRRACTPENGTAFAFLDEVAQATGYATQETMVYPMAA